MKNNILMFLILLTVSISYAQKKKTTQKSTTKYLTYDQYTKLADNLSSENSKLEDLISKLSDNSDCKKFDLYVVQFNNFVKNMRASTQIDYDVYHKYISSADYLEMMEKDTIDYSSKFPKNYGQYFLKNNIYPNPENFRLMKKYINSFTIKQKDSINNCVNEVNKQISKTKLQIETNENKIEKYLYIRDNFSGTWGWITLSNGRRVWARYSNGNYYF